MERLTTGAGRSRTGRARPDAALVQAVRAALAGLADPDRATGMQSYMKSTMPFRGVPAPPRRQLQRSIFAEHPAEDRQVWEATVRTLWGEAEFREERYAAVDLTGVRWARGWQDLDTLPLYEHMIVSGAWWDYVDEIAIRRIGPILRDHPTVVGDLLRRWAVDDDRWRRRTAIIAQIGSKIETDTELLTEVIIGNLGGGLITNDFFVRKGIGWALREYAKTDPDWVRSFVAEHRARLSPLSYREATKHL